MEKSVSATCNSPNSLEDTISHNPDERNSNQNSQSLSDKDKDKSISKKRHSLDGKINQYLVKDSAHGKNGDMQLTVLIPQRVLQGIKDTLCGLMKDQSPLHGTPLTASWSSYSSPGFDLVGFTFYNRLTSGKQGKWKQFEIQLRFSTCEMALHGKHLEYLSDIVLPWITIKLKQNHPNFFLNAELSTLLINISQLCRASKEKATCNCHEDDKSIACSLCLTHACKEAVQCSDCENWHHYSCLGLSQSEISRLTSPEEIFKCVACSQPAPIQKNMTEVIQKDTCSIPPPIRDDCSQEHTPISEDPLYPNPTSQNTQTNSIHAGPTHSIDEKYRAQATQTTIIHIPDNVVVSKVTQTEVSQTTAQNKTDLQTPADSTKPCVKCSALEKTLKEAKSASKSLENIHTTILQEHEKVVTELCQTKRENEASLRRLQGDKDLMVVKEAQIADLKLTMRDLKHENSKLIIANDLLQELCLKNGLDPSANLTIDSDDPFQNVRAPLIDNNARRKDPLFAVQPHTSNRFDVLEDLLEMDSPERSRTCSDSPSISLTKNREPFKTTAQSQHSQWKASKRSPQKQKQHISSRQPNAYPPMTSPYRKYSNPARWGWEGSSKSSPKSGSPKSGSPKSGSPKVG